MTVFATMQERAAPIQLRKLLTNGAVLRRNKRAAAPDPVCVETQRLHTAGRRLAKLDEALSESLEERFAVAA
jgi:hypothetical protein